jgi:hypothetical protein
MRGTKWRLGPQKCCKELQLNLRESKVSQPNSASGQIVSSGHSLPPHFFDHLVQTALCRELPTQGPTSQAEALRNSEGEERAAGRGHARSANSAYRD